MKDSKKELEDMFAQLTPEEQLQVLEHIRTKNKGYITCSYCGEMFVEGEPFCPYCGKECDA